MGYSPAAIVRTTKLLEIGVLKPGCSILEVGAQEAQGPGIAEAVAEVAKFMGLKVDVPQYPDVVPMSDIYRLLGFEYLAIDVNNLHGSMFFDLNTETVPAALKNKFDWVNNEGTLEHVANPLNTLRVIHDFTKPGGYMKHSSPLMGWPDHGLFYATPKLWLTMAGDNKYRIESISSERNDEHVRGPEWYPWLDVAYPDIWIHLSFQKTSDAEFVPPLDHLETDRMNMIRNKLRGNAVRYTDPKDKPLSWWKRTFG